MHNQAVTKVLKSQIVARKKQKNRKMGKLYRLALCLLFASEVKADNTKISAGPPPEVIPPSDKVYEWPAIKR